MEHQGFGIAHILECHGLVFKVPGVLNIEALGIE